MDFNERNDAAENQAQKETPIFTPELVQPEDEPLTVKFSKPYRFEGQTFTEIDLSGLDKLNATDMCAAEKHLNRSGMFSPLPEMTAEYICFVAAQVAEQPIEFFKNLPPKDFIKVKNRITSFFFAGD